MRIAFILCFIFVTNPTWASERLKLKKIKSQYSRELLGALDQFIWNQKNRKEIPNSELIQTFGGVRKKWELLSPFLPETYRKRLSDVLTQSSLKLANLKTPKDIGQWHNALRDEIGASLELDMVPALPLNLNQAKTNFQEHCASCHGSAGAGSGVLSKRLPIPVVDASQGEVQEFVSPAMVFNYLLSEQASGIMPNYTQILSIEELWNMGFYWKTLTKSQESQDVFEAPLKVFTDEGISLHQLALYSDHQLLNWLMEKKLMEKWKWANPDRIISHLRKNASYAGLMPRQKM